MAKKGLPKKYAKHGFKKGWKLYKAAKRKRLSGTTTKTVSKRKPSTSTGASKTMAKSKPKRKIVYRTVKTTRKMGRRKAPKLISQATINTIIDGVAIGGSAIGSTFLMGLLPYVKDQNAWIKALIQGGSGVFMISLVKDKYLKKAGMGMVVGSAISAALPLLPESFKVFGRRKFSPAELHKLQTMGYGQSRVGRPYKLGRPVSLQSVESSPAPLMGRSSNRVSRYR